MLCWRISEFFWKTIYDSSSSLLMSIFSSSYTITKWWWILYCPPHSALRTTGQSGFFFVTWKLYRYFWVISYMCWRISEFFWKTIYDSSSLWMSISSSYTITKWWWILYCPPHDRPIWKFRWKLYRYLGYLIYVLERISEFFLENNLRLIVDVDLIILYNHKMMMNPILSSARQANLEFFLLHMEIV